YLLHYAMIPQEDAQERPCRIKLWEASNSWIAPAGYEELGWIQYSWNSSAGHRSLQILQDGFLKEQEEACASDDSGRWRTHRILDRPGRQGGRWHPKWNFMYANSTFMMFMKVESGTLDCEDCCVMIAGDYRGVGAAAPNLYNPVLYVGRTQCGGSCTPPKMHGRVAFNALHAQVRVGAVRTIKM